MGKIYIIQICSFLLTMINIFVELHGSCKCTSPEHIQFDVLLWKPVWKPWTLQPIVCWASWTPHNFELYIFRVLSLKDSDVLEGLRFLSLFSTLVFKFSYPHHVMVFGEYIISACTWHNSMTTVYLFIWESYSYHIYCVSYSIRSAC